MSQDVGARRLAERAKQLSEHIEKAAEMRKRVAEKMGSLGQADKVRQQQLTPTPKLRPKSATSNAAHDRARKLHKEAAEVKRKTRAAKERDEAQPIEALPIPRPGKRRPKR